jgi:hypothetical protein
MSKAHRGKGIYDKVKRGRGICPLCKRTGVKVLYSHEHNGKTLQICKICRAAVAHGKKKEILSSLGPS